MKSLPMGTTAEELVVEQPVALGGLVSSAKAYAEAAQAPSTLRCYARDWNAFCRWCGTHGFSSLPATSETVALYLSFLADSGRRVATIERALAAISFAHRGAGHPSPREGIEVQQVRKGIRRTFLVAPRQKTPLLPADLKKAFAEMPNTPIAARDRALLTLGFAGGLRRSELVALDLEDLMFISEGLQLRIRRSKTDQEGEGRTIGIPFGGRKGTCPVRLTQEWVQLAEIRSGPVFRAVNRHGRIASTRLSDKAVALVVKRTAMVLGEDVKAFAGHSLRAGLVTAAAKNGKSAHAIMKQTGHRSMATVAKYIRDADVFSDNAAEGLGL